MKNRHWNELSANEKVGVTLLGLVQVSLLVGALRDLWRRPAHEVRGSKQLWAAASFVNFVGPISYFLLGRRR